MAIILALASLACILSFSSFSSDLRLFFLCFLSFLSFLCFLSCLLSGEEDSPEEWWCLRDSSLPLLWLRDLELSRFLSPPLECFTRCRSALGEEEVLRWCLRREEDLCLLWGDLESRFLLCLWLSPLSELVEWCLDGYFNLLSSVVAGLEPSFALLAAVWS